MSIDQVRILVDHALSKMDDDEAAHGMEDELMRSVIRQHAPADVLAEMERLWSAPFERWCA